MSEYLTLSSPSLPKPPTSCEYARSEQHEKCSLFCQDHNLFGEETAQDRSVCAQVPRAAFLAQPKYSASFGVPDKNGEVDTAIFPVVSEMQLGA